MDLQFDWCRTVCSLQAETLDALGLDFEIGFFERVLLHEPDHLDALQILGMAYTRRGLYARGLEVDRRLVELLPHNPTVHYNLGCSLALLGDLDAAIQALERCVGLGYNDFEHMRQDPDLECLHGDPRFERLLRR